ncbi:unnamed protein product [Sphagnum compactum]
MGDDDSTTMPAAAAAVVAAGDPKPWKAEYAKSSRSHCRACSKPISKDTFRLAHMQRAQQFAGFMPVWNHASCIFNEDGKIKSLDDVEGLSDLRAADLQDLRKYVDGTLEHAVHDIVPDKEEGPKVDAAGDDDKNTGEYMIENAKSSRSICKSCNEKIEKGEVRIATMVDNPRFRGKQPAWRHVKCFLEKNWWTSPMEAMPGWDHLSVKDQAHVQTLAKDFTAKENSSPVKEKQTSTLKETSSPSPTKVARLSRSSEKGTAKASKKKSGL